MKRFVALFLVIVSLSVLLAGCGGTTAPSAPAAPPAPKAPATIKIGEIAALTGPTALSGLQERNGVQMAIDEINAKGGLLGAKLELITLDFKGKVEDGVTNYRKLVEQDKVVAVIGTNFSNINIAVSPVADDLKVPVVCNAMDPRATTPEPNKVFAYTFLAQPSSIAQGNMIAKMALDKGFKRAAVLVNNGLAFATSLADPFKTYFAKHGGKVVAYEEFAPGQTDFRAQLTKIKQANPDVIMIPQYAQEAGLAIKQAREQLGMKVPVVGPNTLTSAPFEEAAGAANLDEIYYVYNVNMEDPKFADFISRYKAKYKEDIKTTNVFFGYDNMMIIADAIKRAGKAEPKAIRDALEQMKNVPVLQGDGVITIDPKNHRPVGMPCVVFKYEKGKIKYVGKIMANEAD
ncbi:MAG: ABC transporter substrate-binding protein [Bacillota bacterium]|nr:ABC transporter substrate-binding protein [Bacillota bacterium]